jgi:septal ring factor EnvC (AmiA/AmiB activator)
MRGWQFAVCFMVSSAAWGSSPPVPAPAERAAPAGVSLPQARQRLTQHQARVRRLQQDVEQQESDSRQASERLQQQDRKIAELQQQLQALQRAKSATNQH